MGFFDDDKPNNDHYYSPGEDGEDPRDRAEDTPFSSHYYSPPQSDDEDERVLPFSHVDIGDDEDFFKDDDEPACRDEDGAADLGVTDADPREYEDGAYSAAVSEDEFTEEDIDEVFSERDEFVEPAAYKDVSGKDTFEDEPASENDIEDIKKEKEPFRFVAEDDGYDYSETDDADDMADDDNVFDKEPEFLFNEEYPEEPENLGAINCDEEAVDKDQLTFEDLVGSEVESSDIKEDFFTTPPKAELDTEGEDIFEDEVSGSVGNAASDDTVDAAKIGEIEKEVSLKETFEDEKISSERAAAFEKERDAALSGDKNNERTLSAEGACGSDDVVGNNESGQKNIREKHRRMFMEDSSLNVAKIMVCGVGGAGNNAVNRMIDMNVSTAAFVAINTDKQALMLSKCDMENRYQIGGTETKGLGAGADPDVGERAAEESRELIEEIVDGVDLLFIAAGMGGGTGTGAAPVIARIAREKGCVTVAVVTKPFSFEGRKRSANAERGIANLKKYVDTIIIIPNDKLMEALRPDTPIVDALRYADDTLRQGICGIADLIATPSLINLDFADVRTVIKDQGLAHMGIGRAKGDNRIMEAVREAVSSPLLETTIEGARGIILNVTGGSDLTIRQVNDAARQVQDIVDPSANIIFGMNINEKLQEEVIITLIATGFDSDLELDGEQDEDGDAQSRAYRKLFNNAPEAVEEEEPEQVEEEPSEPEKPVEKEKEKGGIPSFMRRLFKK